MPKTSTAVKFSLIAAAIVVTSYIIYGLAVISSSHNPLAAVGYVFLPLYAGVVLTVVFAVFWALATLLTTAHAASRKKPVTCFAKRQALISMLILVICTALAVPHIQSAMTRLTKPEVVKSESFTNSVGMHMVALSTGYYVSIHETSQSQFEAIMSYNPSNFIGPLKPVESLTIAQALEFCQMLNAHEKQNGTLPAGFVYALPSVDQWYQYIADAPLEGSITPAGLNVPDITSTYAVGWGNANRLGLFNLRGNVCEFSNKHAPQSGYIALGASWNTGRKEFLEPYNQRYVTSTSSDVGFRCVLIPEE